LGNRGKKTIAEFVYERQPGRETEVASWWKQLAGATRALDLGLSIRTSWGWSQAVSDDPVLSTQLGRYLAAAARGKRAGLPANLFLSQAVWLRLAR
jgi:hypothetical protein